MSFLNRDKRKEVASDITSQAAAQVANTAMADMQVATDLTDTGMDLFLQAAKATQNVGFDQRKGNLFEYIESAKFNRNAAKAGVRTRAVVTAADGRPHDPSDIDLIKDGKVIRQVQAKVMDTQKGTQNTSAASSVFSQAGGQKGHWGKYNGMQRLVRKEDQYKIDPETGKPISLVEEARRLAKARGSVQGSPYAEAYNDVAENLTDELTDETTGIKSGGTTLDELRRASDNPERYANRFKMQHSAAGRGGGAAAAAARGAIMSGVVSSISNAFAVFQDEKNLAEAAKEVGATVGKGAVRGGATGALSAVLRIGGKNHGIPVITDSAASTIIAGGIIDTGVSIYAYAQGEISGEQLREDLANTVVKSTVTIYMTKAATLALGGCGAFLPMAVYSVSSYMVACTREIIKNAKLNAEEYLRLTSLLEEETQIVYQQKTALEAQLSQYTDYRLRNMSEFLHRFDDVMQNGGNYDNAIFAIVSYANQTGIVLQHASKTDFDAAMISDNEFILK